MRVVINTLAALGQRTGIGHYADELARRLTEVVGPDRVCTYPQGWLRRLGEAAQAVRRRLVPRADAPLPTAAGRGAGQAGPWGGLLRASGHALLSKYLRRASRSAGWSLYHEPNAIPLESGLPTVATVHDLSLLLHPRWHPADRARYFEQHFRVGLTRCRHVIAVSDFTRREAMRELGLLPGEISRVYQGVRGSFRPLEPEVTAATLRSLRLPPRYLLCVGTIEPRKNILLLLRAYCALPGPVRERLPLLLVGGWGWNAGDVADFLHASARHRGVRHVGYLPEPALPAVYNGATALLYPSLYEGFGLPPLEMMACGGAVIASTAGAVAEACGGRACLIDPQDLDGWRSAMLRAATDEDWRQGLRSGATERAALFSWRRCAVETWKVYQKAAEMPTARAA